MRYNPILKPCKLFTTTTQCITHGGGPGVLNKVRQDKTRQCFIWSLIQSYVYRLYPNNFKIIIYNTNCTLLELYIISVNLNNIKNDLLLSQQLNTYFAISFYTGLFLLRGFINNRKTSSGAILFTDILYSLFKYSNKVLLFS